MMPSFRLLLVVLTLPLAFSAAASPWPGWRGPGGTGVSTEKDFPFHWSTNQNVIWRVDLPGRGNSSPIVWGDRVFVTQAVSAENRRTVMCFDRGSGRLLWQAGPTYTEREQTQRDNPFCAATPVTDGERVIASFGSAGLYCYDYTGRELWKRDFGKMNHMFGNAASPVLHGELCYLNFGPDEKARLIAVNKKTGETVWESQPPKIEPGEQAPGRGGGGGGIGGAGPGGRGGGFGLGNTLGPVMLTIADKDGDQKLSRDEFSALADAMYDRLDPEKTGKVGAAQFAEKFYDALPRPQNAGGGGQQRGPSRTTAPAFFGAADADKDGSLTRAELKSTFIQWFEGWDSAKTGFVTEDKLREGLTAALPRPNFGGETAGGGARGPGGGGGRGGLGGGASWSTPILIQAGEREELIMNFPNRLVALDPKTGQTLWSSKGVGGTIYTTPVWGEGVLYAMTSGPGGGGAIAVKPGGSGDVTENRRAWKLDRVKGAIGSGVIHGGHLFILSQDGIATCLSLRDGSTVWEERLRGAGSRNGSWSSMILAGDRIYVPNQSGDVFVLRAAPKFEVLATNAVGEPTNASLAASGGALFLRTDKGLWCLAATK